MLQTNDKLHVLTVLVTLKSGYDAEKENAHC